MRFMTTVVHRVEGRLRLRVNRIKNRPSSAASLQASLKTVGGVTDASANPLTGSVLIVYDPWQLTERDLLDLFGIYPLYVSPFDQSPEQKLGTMLLRHCLKAAIEVALWRLLPCAL
jgi:Heavy metal associated domain 2